MNHVNQERVRLTSYCLWATLVCSCLGCGFIADKDLIKIAKFQGQYVTRGDLFRVLRNTPPEERPLIQTKGDLLRMLEGHIHDKIKTSIAAALSAENKIAVSRETAARVFDFQNPDFVVDIPNPEEYNLTQGDIDIMREEREIRIDRIQQKLLGEEAMRYLIEQGVKAGTLAVTQEETEAEYRLRKQELMKPEIVTFRGIGFPKALPNASAQAARIRQRLDNGESFEDVAREYNRSRTAYVLQTTVPNDPRITKLQSFWLSASGTEVGDIIGPVFVQAPEVEVPDEQGRRVRRALPDAYMVCEILAHTPQTVMSIEEATPELVRPLYYAKLLKQLEQEFGVEIYEDRLPDPSMYTTPD